MRTPVPPFEPGEEAVKQVPDELLQPIRDRVAADEQFELVSCVWYSKEKRQCRHYHLRPDACRNFEIGSDACRLSRWDAGVDI